MTSVNNEVYGIYAFDSVDGLFEDSYASGSADAGFYIGQCDPCNAVIRGVVAERNALGYSGTNASGNLHIVSSTWRHNVAGIVPNTLDTELLPPAERVDVVGNVVVDNGVDDVPTLQIEWPSYGAGIIAAGTNDVRIERNRNAGNALHGVLVTPNLSDHLWIASGNQIRGNVITGSGRADLALAGPAGAGNCFTGNTAGRTVPAGLEVFQACDGPRLPWRWDLSTVANNLGYVAEAARGLTPDNPPRRQPAAPPQPQLAGGAQAPVVPAVDVYDQLDVDLATIALPDAPGELSDRHAPEVLVSGLPLLATGFWSVLFGLYAYLLPFVLLAAWVTLSLWDLARRDDLSRAAIIGWIAVILLVPFVGVIGYLVARATLPGWVPRDRRRRWPGRLPGDPGRRRAGRRHRLTAVSVAGCDRLVGCEPAHEPVECRQVDAIAAFEHAPGGEHHFALRQRRVRRHRDPLIVGVAHVVAEFGDRIVGQLAVGHDHAVGLEHRHLIGLAQRIVRSAHVDVEVAG